MKLQIVEFIGDKNNQNIQYGTPFLVIGYCGGEWELSKTNWYDVKNDHIIIIAQYENLLADLSVNDDNFKKYFNHNCYIDYN
jgi:hypothetical protein